MAVKRNGERSPVKSPAAGARQLREAQVGILVERLMGYSKPYEELMVRREQGEHVQQMLIGLLGDGERKSIEPIAIAQGIAPRVLQGFMGITTWDHQPLRDLLRAEVTDEIGADDGTLILDGSSVPKKGKGTVGVKRQWCGHAGKVDNCVTGVHAVYVGADGCAVMVDSDVYLPREWTDDEDRRAQGHVPEGVKYRTIQEIAAWQVDRAAKHLPFSWVLADEEFGRARWFRDWALVQEKCYAMSVPKNTTIERLAFGMTVCREMLPAEQVIAGVKPGRWKVYHVRKGTKGPITVRAVALTVQTPRKRGARKRELLVVTEKTDGTERSYHLVGAPPGTPLIEILRRIQLRHRVEEVFGEAKGEVGMDHYELRSYHGWHHHMTLVAISHWFLLREKRRLKLAELHGITVSMVRKIVSKLIAIPSTIANVTALANYLRDRNIAVMNAHYAALGLPPPDLAEVYR